MVPAKIFKCSNWWSCLVIAIWSTSRDWIRFDTIGPLSAFSTWTTSWCRYPLQLFLCPLCAIFCGFLAKFFFFPCACTSTHTVIQFAYHAILSRLASLCLKFGEGERRSILILQGCGDLCFATRLNCCAKILAYTLSFARFLYLTVSIITLNTLNVK